MRAQVVYASQFGSTLEIAERIAAVLSARGVEAAAASAEDASDPDGFDAVVIGSAVHGAHWLPAATAFARRIGPKLEARPVWLFSSGPIGDHAAGTAQPDPREVAELRPVLHPRDHRVFAGSFDRATADFSPLGIIERTVVRRFLPDGDWRDWEAIESWAAGIARSLAGSRPVAAQ